MKTWQLTTHSFCDGMSGRVKFRFSLLQSSIQVHVKKSQTKILCCVSASESSSSSDTQPGSQRRTFWILALFNNSLRKRPTEFKVKIFETPRSIAIVSWCLIITAFSESSQNPGAKRGRKPKVEKEKEQPKRPKSR